jgi:hypothetical protein
VVDNRRIEESLPISGFAPSAIREPQDPKSQWEESKTAVGRGETQGTSSSNRVLPRIRRFPRGGSTKLSRTISARPKEANCRRRHIDETTILAPGERSTRFLSGRTRCARALGGAGAQLKRFLQSSAEEEKGDDAGPEDNLDRAVGTGR